VTGGQGRPTGRLIGGPTGRPGGGPTGVLGGGPTGVLGGGPTGRLIGGLTGGRSTGEHGGGVADADEMAPMIATPLTAGTASAADKAATLIDDRRDTISPLLPTSPLPPVSAGQYQRQRTRCPGHSGGFAAARRRSFSTRALDRASAASNRGVPLAARAARIAGAAQCEPALR
jgi:hypothetical protein